MEELSSAEATPTFCKRPPFAVVLLGCCQASASPVFPMWTCVRKRQVKMPKRKSSGSKRFLGRKSWCFPPDPPHPAAENGSVLLAGWGTCWLPSSKRGRAPLQDPHTLPLPDRSRWTSNPWDTVSPHGAGRSTAGQPGSRCFQSTMKRHRFLQTPFFKGHNLTPKAGADRSRRESCNPKTVYWKTANSRFPKGWEEALFEFVHGLKSSLPRICWRAELTRASQKLYFPATGRFPGKRSGTLPACRHGHTHQPPGANWGVKAQLCTSSAPTAQTNPPLPARGGTARPSALQRHSPWGKGRQVDSYRRGADALSPTPFLSSPRLVCVTIPTRSEPPGGFPRGKRVLATL